jgi:hypothetical protein
MSLLDPLLGAIDYGADVTQLGAISYGAEVRVAMAQPNAVAPTWHRARRQDLWRRALICNHKGCLAQLVENKVFKLVVVGSSSWLGSLSLIYFFVVQIFRLCRWFICPDFFYFCDWFVYLFRYFFAFIFVFLTYLPLSTVLNTCHQIYHTKHLRNISNQRYKYLFTDRIRRSGKGKGRRVSVEYFFLVD